VNVHEVHHGAEPSPVDQIAHRATEHEADGEPVQHAARCEDPHRHPGQHDQRPQRQGDHHPSPRQGQSSQQPEGQARVEHQREGQQAVHDGNRDARGQMPQDDHLGDLIERDHDRRDHQDRGHAGAVITARQRSQRVGCA
jgi:hypothetical protein